jgi:hypothetical protein
LSLNAAGPARSFQGRKAETNGVGCVQAEQERNGTRFDPAVMLETRERTRAAMDAVAAAIRPGMTEEEAVALMRRTLKDAGMLRGCWAITRRCSASCRSSSRGGRA